MVGRRLLVETVLEGRNYYNNHEHHLKVGSTLFGRSTPKDRFDFHCFVE